MAQRVVKGGFLEEVFELAPVLCVVTICRPVEPCLGQLWVSVANMGSGTWRSKV